jgi:predicted transcriptional regulator
MAAKPVTSYRLDAPTRKAIEIMAAKEKRSEAQIIEFAIEEYFLKHYEEEFEKLANENNNQN